MKPFLAHIVTCAFLVGCGPTFDVATGDADAPTMRDAPLSPAADADPEEDRWVDANETANGWIDASSDASPEAAQGPASDAGADFDRAPQIPADAAGAHDSEHRDSRSGGDAWIPVDQGTDQGTTVDATVVIPTIDASPPDETWCGNQTFATTTTIESGKTVAVCAGAVLTFGPSASLVVQGTLRAEGTASMPILLIGQPETSGAWGGLTVYAGGSAVLAHTEIRDATIAFSTAVSAQYALDHVVLHNSRLLLHLMSSGTIAHATMHALGDLQSTLGDAIVIDDASPHIVDSTVDNGSAGADLIQVNGASSAPLFERMDVSGSHCAFHFNESTKATIKSSYIHDCSYGFMVVYGTQSLLTGNNFERNGVVLGLCLGGGNAAFTGNYIDGIFADTSCSVLKNDAPLASPILGVGPGP